MSDRPLPAWLEPLYTAEEMRAVDAWAIEEQGVPSLELMERAGAEVARVVTELAPPGPVRIVCGKGNNGGDGLVVARLLREHGHRGRGAAAVRARRPAAPTRAPTTSGWRGARRGGACRRRRAAAALAGSGVVVDALLGTGFEGEPGRPSTPRSRRSTRRRRRSWRWTSRRASNASTGEVEGACVRADVTVTFHGAKLGLWVDPGKSHAGRVEVVDIGIPPLRGAPAARRRGPDRRRRARACCRRAGADVEQVQLRLGARGRRLDRPHRRRLPGLRGRDARRRRMGARRRAGSLNAIFEVKLTEVMSVPLPDDERRLLAGAPDAVLEAAERADAVVLGPGPRARAERRVRARA